MTALDPIPRRPASLTETVYARVREAIVTSRIPPGAQVTEAGLADELGVSKTPVREALVRLAHIGLVEPETRRGMRVVRPSVHAIRDAYEVRTALEAQTVRLAAQRREDAEAEEITRLARASLEAVEAGDRAGFVSYDQQFHLAIAGASGNRQLRILVADYIDLANTLRRRDVPEAGDSLECAREHVLIAEAIAERNVETAHRRLREHLTNVQYMVEDGFARASESTAV